MMKRLLVIDDSRGVRTFLQHSLSPYFQVQVAPDAHRGLELFREQHYDLVLCDINLPGMNGFGMHAAVRSINPFHPIALMTDAEIDPYLQEALSCQVANIFAKASFKADLEGTIRLLLDLEQRLLQGMERRLGPGGEVRTYVVGSAEEVPDVLKQCHRILDRFPRREVYRRLLPELVQNAFAHGSAARQGLYPRPGQYVRISVGADWQRVGLGVSDAGGNLTHRRTLEYLTKALAENPEIDLTSGRGQGLLLARKQIHQTYITIIPGQQTEVLCFDLIQGYSGPVSLHVNELPPVRPLS